MNKYKYFTIYDKIIIYNTYIKKKFGYRLLSRYFEYF